MEATMTMPVTGFTELGNEELAAIDGGSYKTAGAILMFGGAVVAGILAPVTCGGSVLAFAEGALTGYGAMAAGAVISCGG